MKAALQRPRGNKRYGRRSWHSADRRSSILFIGLPWLIFHYITKWKTGGDADRLGRETARRAARRRAPARRPAVHDRADHDRREPELAPAVPARAERRERLLPTENDVTMTRCPTEQPPSRTRFYRDKRNGKIMGVCAGIADYTGFDVTLVRIMLVAAVFMSSGSHPAALLHRRLHHPRQAARARLRRPRGAALLAGRPRIADAHRARHPQSACATSTAASPTSKAM